ncbi:MAG: hypothetical protein HC882_00265 [Acidobacteria bacterium]|nr:hypothetical protein [Acidobacteriota bacterium]
MALTLEQAANDPSTPSTSGILRRITLANSVNSQPIIIPATWAGKFVRFVNDSPAATGPVVYVRFSLTEADSAIVIANTSTVSAGPNPPTGTVFNDVGQPDLVIGPGSFIDERIDESWVYFGVIASAATGLTRVMLKQGRGVENV